MATQLSVTVPEGTCPGDQIPLTLPDGRQFQETAFQSFKGFQSLMEIVPHGGRKRLMLSKLNTPSANCSKSCNRWPSFSLCQ
ncbi:MAG: hypothetical protein SGPRY_005712, partial [Prymnesium sp.]